METINLGNSGVISSEIALGCMRICGLDLAEAEKLIRTAVEQGITLFDHADIYGDGKSEELFASVLKKSPSLKDNMIIQTKCGIHDGLYDFSKEHILSSVDKSLKRLNCECIDILLLHRPDALMEAAEVSEAFDTLYSAGKVKHFGVSNQNPYQMALLQKFSKHKLIANQMQLSLTNTGMIDAGINVNTQGESAVVRDGSVLDYCQLNDITIQAWSPFQYGFFEGVFLDNAKFPELNQKIDELAAKYDVTNSAIAIAWILRHPAKIQPIVGTTNAKRLMDICAASRIKLTRAEWYDLYKSAGNMLP